MPHSTASTSKRPMLQQVWRASAAGLAVVLLFSAFINPLKFAMPLYTLQILDRIPSSRSIETLFMLTLVALLAVLAGVAMEAIRKRMLNRWGGWIERRFGPVLVAAGIGMMDGDSSSANKALGDLRTLRLFIERAVAPMLDLMWAPVFVAAVYLIHPLLGAIMLGAIATRVLLALAQESLVSEPRRVAGHARDDARDIVTSAQRNVDTVRALGMAESLSLLWHGSMSTRLDERDRASARSDLMAALGQGLYRVLYVGGMGTGIYLVIFGELTIGGVIAANIILRFGFRIVDRGARRWRMLIRARSSYRRLQTQLDAIGSARADVSSTSGVSIGAADLDAPLLVEQVSHRYQGSNQSVLKRLNLSLERGELLSIMGPSGSGKSTLAKLLVGRFQPRHGRVLLGNVAVARLPDQVKASFVGYLPQHSSLFDGSVRDNIARMDRGDLDTVIDAARLAGIHDTIVRLPQGYDTVLDNEASRLSGGEFKRIALARAFYGRPRLVVLDEPEAALDRTSRRVLRKALQILRDSGSTVVVTTQSGGLAKSADRCLILGGDGSRLVAGKDAVAPVAAVKFEDLDLGRRGRSAANNSRNT